MTDTCQMLGYSSSPSQLSDNQDLGMLLYKRRTYHVSHLLLLKGLQRRILLRYLHPDNLRSFLLALAQLRFQLPLRQYRTKWPRLLRPT